MERTQTDPAMLRLEIALEKAVDEGLTAQAEEIRRLIESYRTTQLSAAQTQELLAAIAMVITATFASMAETTRDTQVAIAQSQVRKELKRYKPLLKQAGAPVTYIAQFERDLEDYAERVRKRFYTRPFPADQVSYRFRIKTVRDSTERTVRNIIRNGNRKGHNPNKIAKRVTAYLKPGDGGPVYPLKEAREASRADKGYKPQGIRSGKLPYQAKRIARTESAETYRAAHSEMFEGTILEGGQYDWLLSNSHAGPDRCDDLAYNSPYSAKQRPHSHPNCLCTWSKRPPTLADVRRLLREEGVIQ